VQFLEQCNGFHRVRTSLPKPESHGFHLYDVI